MGLSQSEMALSELICERGKPFFGVNVAPVHEPQYGRNRENSAEERKPDPNRIRTAAVGSSEVKTQHRQR